MNISTSLTDKYSTYSIYVAKSPPQPTVVFRTFWEFAAKRQVIFFSRVKGLSGPWTDDPILNTYKFTNAYRASDRVSQYLIRNIIYDGLQTSEEIFFRVILFKLFNKIETWELLKSNLGAIEWRSYNYDKYNNILSYSMLNKKSIYSAAYIMASGHKIFNVEKKHQSHLKLLERMMVESLPAYLETCSTMREGFEIFRSYPLIGDFLAYQLITDINYSNLTNFSEMEFTMPGPGARDGIRKCFSSLGDFSEMDIIHMMADRQECEFQKNGIEFPSLWGRKLQLIDVQNLFCEVDKYSRIKHPEICGISGRIRIKQKYKDDHKSPIDYFYPPKWQLNTKAFEPFLD